MSKFLYGCENWFLNDAVLNLLHSLLGELSKRILRLLKWYSNTAAMVVLDWDSARARCLERKLCFLHRITKDLDTATDSLSSHMFCAFSDNIESTCLVLECLELEDYFELKLTRPVLAGVCALDDDPEPVSSLSPRDLKKIIFSRDKALLLEKCAANDDAKLISEIAQVICWSKLWDLALDKGPRCVNGLKALVRIITYPSHATGVCPKCDVNELEVSLLAHILLEHFNAIYSESDLLGALLNSNHNQVLPDSIYLKCG